jgi:hypothetical protein
MQKLGAPFLLARRWRNGLENKRLAGIDILKMRIERKNEQGYGRLLVREFSSVVYSGGLDERCESAAKGKGLF